MKKMNWIALSAALMIGGVAFVQAEEKAAPTTKPAKVAAPKKVRINKPFNLITTLTEDQKAKIDAIEEKVREELKKIEAQKEADITALLTDEQKAELKTALEKEEADKKAKMDAAKKEKGNGAKKEEAAPAK